MADQYDDDTRKSASEIAEDDPLAELARIIGYDRPTEQQAAAVERGSEDSEIGAIDLEAELLRELEGDQAGTAPGAPGASEPLAVDPDDETMIADNWLVERPTSSAFDGFPPIDNETADSGDDTVLAVPEQPTDLELPEEDLFDALEQELAISVDELSLDEGGGAESGQETGWPEDESAPKADWDEEAWEHVVAETTAQPLPDPGQSHDGVTEAADQVSVEATSHDDDILSDMAQYHMPSHAVAGENLGPASAISRSADLEFGLTDQIADVSESDSSEDELGEFDALLDGDGALSDQNPDDVTTASVAEADLFDELEADFDNSAESFLVDEEFELDEDAAELVTTPVFDVAPESPEAREEPDKTFGTVAEATAYDSRSLAEWSDDPDLVNAGYDGDAAYDPALANDEVQEADRPAAAYVEPASGNDIASAFSDFLPKISDSDTVVSSAEIAEEEIDWPENAGEEDPNPPSKLFGAAAAMAAGAVSMTPNRAPAEKIRDTHVESGELIDGPDFDENEWLEALGIDEAQDGGTNTGPYGQHQGNEGDLASAHGDGVLSFPASGQLGSPGFGYESSLSDLPVGGPGSDVFDESAISDTGDSPYLVGNFEVPDIPTEETHPAAEDESHFDSDLDREFATLVETVSQEARSGHSANWLNDDGSSPPTSSEDDYAELADNLGLTDASDSDETYRPRPRPVPVDADAALSNPPGFATGGPDNKRGPMIAAVVLGAAVLFGGIALSWNWLSGGSSSGDGPKIIMADKEPVKVLPENPGGTKVPNQDKAVYDKVDGNSRDSAEQRSLTDSSEEPVDVVRQTIDPDLLPLEGRDMADSGKGEARLTAEDNESGVTEPGLSSPVVSPRKVRTMVVKPDGTIVPREDPVEAAVAEPAVVPQPVAPPVAEIEKQAEPVGQAPAVVASETPEPAAQTETLEPAAQMETAEAADSETDASSETSPPVNVVKTVTIRKAPVPVTRPSDQPVNVVGQVSETGRVSGAQEPLQQTAVPVTRTAPAAAPVAAPVAQPTNIGGYYVQIASQPSEEAARESYANLSRRFSGVIGGLGVDIQRADIPNKGVYHRVRIPAGEKNDAINLCERYKSAGGSCFVTR